MVGKRGRSSSLSPAAKSPAPNRESIVDKLRTLREVVGAEWSETDLTNCLSASGYRTELAIERMITGQYQPSKKVKAATPKPSITTLAAIPKPSSESETKKAGNSLGSTSSSLSNPKGENSSSLSDVSKGYESTSLKKDAIKKTHLALNQNPMTNRKRLDYAETVSKKERNKKFSSVEQIKEKSYWLLCQRWISDAVCMDRKGSTFYQEKMRLDHTGSGPMALYFRGDEMHGQFPKYLAAMLVPLLRRGLLFVQAEALMEDKYVVMGGHVALSIRVWLPDAAAFFAIFDERANSLAPTSLYCSKNKRKSSSKSKHPDVQSACFLLLQWAEHGEKFSFENAEREDDDHLEHAGHGLDDSEGELPVSEENTPEWAKRITDVEDIAKNLPEMEEPPNLHVTLRPYQKQALAWMMKREEVPDTLELQRQLSLLSDLAPDQKKATFVNARNGKVYCECGPIVVPESMSVEICAVDGSDAESSHVSHPLWERRFIASHDLSEVRCFFVQPIFGVATSSPPNPPAPCRGGVIADSMGLGKTIMLLALICQSRLAGKSDPGPTLVVGPLSLLAQWEEELESKTELSYSVYYGEAKSLSTKVDVIITTYGVVQGEYQKLKEAKTESKKSENIGLFAVDWKRVVLDEAHYIRNGSTATSRACCLLRSTFRWCLSGTIIQNSVDDVYPLFRFLRHEPWCEHPFWKAAIGKLEDKGEAFSRLRSVLGPIMLRRTKETLDKDGCPILTLPPVESKMISVELSPAERQFYDALHQRSLDVFQGFIRAGTASKSWFAIFSLLHRLRLACDHVALTIKSHLDDDAWNKTISGSQEEKNEQESGSKNVDNMFLENILEKFRSMQSCLDVSAVKDKKFANGVARMISKAVQNNASHFDDECPFCVERTPVGNALITPCLHIFCKPCLLKVLNRKTAKKENESQSIGDSLLCPNGPCPVCNTEIVSSKILCLSQANGVTSVSYLSGSTNRPFDSPVEDARKTLNNALRSAESSKILAMLNELREVWKEDPGSKVLIFSQFLGCLDLLGNALRANKIPFSRLDGKLNIKERMAVLKDFGSKSGTPASNDESEVGSVLLISMKAGGVGLNLTAARTVFIADPWWNAAVEDQCINRIHRIGQNAEKVRVRKFCVANSVEERIVELQNRKTKVARQVMEHCEQSESQIDGNRPSLDDFRILFQVQQAE